MLIASKPVNDTKLTFAPMGAKPKLKVKPNNGNLQNANSGDAVQDARTVKPQPAASAPKKTSGGSSLQKTTVNPQKKVINNMAQSAAMTLVKAQDKTKGDVGKKNNGTTTGFKAVTKNAKKEGYSKGTAQKIAGAQYQKMKRAGKL